MSKNKNNIGRLVIEGDVTLRMEPDDRPDRSFPARYYLQFEIDHMLYQRLLDLLPEDAVGIVKHHYLDHSGKLECEVIYNRDKKGD